MKITQIFAEHEVTISFEVFPPKTDDRYATVEKAACEIAALHPSFMSVTYGAGGGTSQNTASIAADIQDKFHTPVLAHLTCVSSTREHVRNMVNIYKEKGIENIMALRGDIPKEGRSVFEYNHACELIHDIKSIDDSFCIGGACYPEKHPESATQAEDIDHLKEKVDAGCSFLTTQMFFDNALLYRFLDTIRAAGIGVPVVAGIMPITAASQIHRAIALSGSYVPAELLALADKYGDDPAAMKQVGIGYAIDQVTDLYAKGVYNVHIYSMNKPEVAQQIQSSVSGILKP